MMEAILNLFMLLVLPFLFLGTVNRVKSFWAGRQGPSILQPFHDFVKLLRKGEIVSVTTSAVFRLGPCVNFAAILLAGLLVPMASRRAVMGFEGDFILFAYILGLGKFFTILSALDTGSAFEGRGASREASFSSLAEPGFFLTVASLAAIGGGASFERILSVFPAGDGISLLAAVLAGIALFIMMLAEGSRMPVDDPNTHLELTMIHEVMVLDNSGPGLALINYAAGMKLVIFGGIIAALFNPVQENPFLSAMACTGIILLIAAGIGLVESLMARLRMVHVPQFLLVMTSLALIALSTVILFLKTGA
jgi:formate hydrogenlyase subunit 4